MKIIATFLFNGKNYVIYLKGDNVIFGYFNNGDIDNKLNSDEMSMLYCVYDQIRVQPSTSVFCGMYQINGNDFKIFMDTRNSMYSFLLNKDGKDSIPSEEQLKFLNNYYNHQKLVFNICSDDIKKFVKSGGIFFFRVVKIYVICIIVPVCSCLAFNALPDLTKFNVKYQLASISAKDLTELNKNYEYEDLIAAINQNKKLPDEDKKFLIESLALEFNENKEYMDIEAVIKKLKTLDVDYIKSFTYDNKLKKYVRIPREEGVTGIYIYLLNKIRLYDSVDEKEISENYISQPFTLAQVSKSCYFHEANHVLTNETWESVVSDLVEALRLSDTSFEFYNDIVESMQPINNNTLLLELTDELFSREYFSEYNDNNQLAEEHTGYQSKMPYIYALAELLDEKTLREYKYNTNSDIIISALLKIDDNKEKAYELITSINSIDMYTYNYTKAFYDENGDMKDMNSDEEEEFIKASREQKNNYKKIHDSFAYFYEKKYHRDMSDDMIMLSYFMNTGVATAEERQKVLDFLGIEEFYYINGVQPKGYLSSYYKEKNPGVTIYYGTSKESLEDNLSSIVIDDNNRYLEDLENRIKM